MYSDEGHSRSPGHQTPFSQFDPTAVRPSMGKEPKVISSLPTEDVVGKSVWE